MKTTPFLSLSNLWLTCDGFWWHMSWLFPYRHAWPRSDPLDELPSTENLSPCCWIVVLLITFRSTTVGFPGLIEDQGRNAWKQKPIILKRWKYNNEKRKTRDLSRSIYSNQLNIICAGKFIRTSWISLRNLGSNQGVYIRARGPVCKKEKHSGTKLNIII